MSAAGNQTPVPVIAIDGPSGAGKGTLAGRLASYLGWHLLDSGAVYRLLAKAAMDSGTSLDDPDALASLARSLEIRFGRDPDGTARAYLNGRDVSREIRTEGVGAGASRVAAHPAVRAALLALQRSFRRPPGLVADGRDMRSVVFPDAPVSFFLTADVEERARRRYKQLKEKGVDANLRSLLDEIATRDRRDRERAAAPLVVCDGAIVLDSTGKSIDDVLAEALSKLPPGLRGVVEST